MTNNTHFQRLPDGRLLDLRFRFHRGDRVHILAGHYGGRAGVVDGLGGQVKEGGQLVTVPGYNIQLDDGMWVTLPWEIVKSQ